MKGSKHIEYAAGDAEAALTVYLRHQIDDLRHQLEATQADAARWKRAWERQRELTGYCYWEGFFRRDDQPDQKRFGHWAKPRRLPDGTTK